eukprot:5500023-Amphidinium_carterae.1
MGWEKETEGHRKERIKGKTRRERAMEKNNKNGGGKGGKPDSGKGGDEKGPGLCKFYSQETGCKAGSQCKCLHPPRTGKCLNCGHMKHLKA